ncbi:MAG: DUF5668 domain-containing protein [Vicinamibacterales bacterium]
MSQEIRREKSITVAGVPLTPQVVVGALIALFGIVLTLDRLHLVDADRVLRIWPLGVVAIGALIFAQGRARGGGLNGILMMVVGAWLLLNTLGVTRVRIWDLFWPLMLILIGVSLVRQTLRREPEPGELAAGDQVTLFAMLSGVQRASSSLHFHGGDIFAMMGGCHLDLRQATIGPGEVATIEIFTVMGGSEITVPPAWTVDAPVMCVMGGIEDKRLPALPGSAPAAAGLAAPRLVLRGFVLMGGVQIKS